jgi:hypothetical protein
MQTRNHLSSFGTTLVSSEKDIGGENVFANKKQASKQTNKQTNKQPKPGEEREIDLR